MDYKSLEEEVARLLDNAHNRELAPTRCAFFDDEFAFFETNIRNRNVLVVGCGLGHDSFELAKYNAHVTGIDIFPSYVAESTKRLKQFPHLQNVDFQVADILANNFSKNQFDIAILNMGTICNFDNKADFLLEMTRVAHLAYVDFYIPGPSGREKRGKFYTEEGFIKVLLREDEFYNADGFSSKAISKEDFAKIVNESGLHASYIPINSYTLMAPVWKK